jgi:peroxiredoxin
MNRTFASTIISILLLFSVLSPGALAKGDKAANFALKDMRGKTVKLTDFKGKAVVLNFWATWCGPCKKEIPDLISLYNEYKKKGVVILGIALDDKGVEVVKPFVERNKISYPVLIGGGEVVEAYGGFSAIPTTFFIDKNGMIQNYLTGMQAKGGFEREIQNLLKAK